MATVRDLIKSSLRLIGAIASGETPSANESADALYSLNDMLESWSLSGYLIYEIKREIFILTPSKQSYTIGNLGDFDTSRPIRIHDASILESNAEFKLDILNDSQWANIPIKSINSSMPRYIHSSNSFPLDTLSLWPKPEIASSLVLYSMKQLGSFTSLDDNVVFPPGYSKAIRYNLALELAPEYGKDPSALVAMTAQDSKAEIQRFNIDPVYIKSDAIGLAGQKKFNWLSGE